MRKFLLPKALMAFTALTLAASATARPRPATESRIPQLRSFNPGIFAATPAGMNGISRAATTDPDKVLVQGNSITYLLAPDGTVWYAMVNLDYEEVELPGGYATEKQIKGFDITVYDNLYNEVGKVTDTYTLAEGETKVASIQVDMTLSKKFFNSDEKNEIIVTAFCNTPSYSVKTHSIIYSVGGEVDELGHSKKLMEIPGYVIDSKNLARDSWSENYFISFLTTEQLDPENPYSVNNVITTYKKAGWSTPTSELFNVTIGGDYLPGDGMSAPYFMITETADNKPAFAVSRYEKTYFEDPSDYTNDATSPDNHLLIDVYTMNSVSDTSVDKTYSTSIAMDAPDADQLAKFYGIGTFSGYSDVNFSDYTADGTPNFIVTVAGYPTTDPDNPVLSFYLYNSAGEMTMTIDEGSESFVNFSEVKGENSQAMFVKKDEAENYTFHIVDLLTGQTVTTLPAQLEDHGLTTTIDRVCVNGQTRYVSRLSDHIEVADGPIYEQVAWITPEGTIDHIDKLNLGTGVMDAMVYISAEALTPYLFDTDSDMEYLVLIKRAKDEDTTAVDEVLLIADTKSDPLFEATPDNENGQLSSVSIMNAESTPTLAIIYATADYSTYTQQLYSLPLSKFTGGDGTAENPYLISTIADLQQVKGNPQAFYKLANDIDAAGYSFSPIESFSGSLDGDSHSISNLTLAPAYNQAIFSNTTGATVKNLTLIGPVIDITDDVSDAAIIISSAMETTIDNIHIYGLKVDNEMFEGSFGAVAATMSNYSTATNCYVAAAGINLPEASVGGIANTIQTGSSVKVSSFTGSINAGETVGGIVADGGSDFVVEDCHVDADIVAKNTVGGIVGDASRGLVNRNVVEGTIEATQPGMWSSISMGGVAGSLQMLYPDYDDEGNPVYDPNAPKVITNNIVALSEMTVPQAPGATFTGEHDTAHRIVGWTSANSEPEPIGYDEDYNPIYSDEPSPADNGLANNYVAGSLAPVQESIADDPATTEGKSLADGELNREFLESLGFSYGTTTDAPWSELAMNIPYLHFEQKFLVNRTEYSVTVGESFNVEITILSRAELSAEDLMSDFLCDFNESILEMGDMAYDGKVLTLGFNCIGEGTTSISISMLGSSANIMVYGLSGIDAAKADAARAISFDGQTVKSPESRIAIYNLSGIQVASGVEAVNVADLAKGVYIVSATSANGTAVRKIAVK